MTGTHMCCSDKHLCQHKLQPMPQLLPVLPATVHRIDEHTKGGSKRPVVLQHADQNQKLALTPENNKRTAFNDFAVPKLLRTYILPDGAPTSMQFSVGCHADRLSFQAGSRQKSTWRAQTCSTHT